VNLRRDVQPRTGPGPGLGQCEQVRERLTSAALGDFELDLSALFRFDQA